MFSQEKLSDSSKILENCSAEIRTPDSRENVKRKFYQKAESLATFGQKIWRFVMKVKFL
jgi:hypothetical protein